MAPHSSTLAWKIPWTEEPGRRRPTESDTTERLHFHFSLSCIGEGNGNPLQCSCLENPRDGEAWWAAVYGVAQSQTRLKWLSSSSMEFRQMVTMTLYVRQQMRHRCKKKTSGLCGRRQGWGDLREYHWNMYIIICETDLQSRRCMRQGTQGWCLGMTLRDGMGKEVAGGFRMGNTCTPMAVSCQCMAKTTAIL